MDIYPSTCVFTSEINVRHYFFITSTADTIAYQACIGEKEYFTETKNKGSRY